jgi:hypothetical protein
MADALVGIGDSTDYVEAVMATQATFVDNAVGMSEDRKRRRSDECDSGQDSGETVKRNKADGEMSTEALDKILGAITSMESTFSQRLDALEGKIMENVMHVVRDELSEVRTHFDHEVRILTDTVTRVEKSYAEIVTMNKESGTVSNADITRNIVIRNLRERVGENTSESVNTFIKDGLKLANVKVIKAERKSTHGDGRRPGIVVATCKSNDDKRQIMISKRQLKDSEVYKDVYVEHDQSRTERVQRSNMNTIIHALGRGELAMRGERVVSVREQRSDYRRPADRRSAQGRTSINTNRPDNRPPRHVSESDGVRRNGDSRNEQRRDHDRRSPNADRGRARGNQPSTRGSKR